MKRTNNYEINHIDETIIITKKFYKAASVLNSPEYKELMQIRRDNPTFKIVLREIKKNANKETYRNLTIKNMEDFIKAKETDGTVREARLAQFKTVKELSKVQAGPYAYGKTGRMILDGKTQIENQLTDEVKAQVQYNMILNNNVSLSYTWDGKKGIIYNANKSEGAVYFTVQK